MDDQGTFAACGKNLMWQIRWIIFPFHVFDVLDIRDDQAARQPDMQRVIRTNGNVYCIRLLEKLRIVCREPVAMEINRKGHIVFTTEGCVLAVVHFDPLHRFHRTVSRSIREVVRKRQRQPHQPVTSFGMWTYPNVVKQFRILSVLTHGLYPWQEVVGEDV